MKRLELFLMMVQVPLDFLLLISGAAVAYLLRFTPWALSLKSIGFDLSFTAFLALAIPVALAWVVLFAISGLYTPSPSRRFAQDVMRVISATSTGLSVVALYIMFTQQQFDSRFLLAASWVCATIFVIAGRLFMRAIKGMLYRAGLGLRCVVLIGTGAPRDVVAAELSARKGLGYRVVGSFDHFSLETAHSLDAMSFDEMIYLNPRSNEQETLAALEYSVLHHLPFKYSADLFATYSANMSVHPLAGIPIVELKRTRLEGWGRVVKRLFDIIFSLFAILLTSPLTLLTALVILCETGRPIIYKNERVGARGEHFFTYKFRSMHQKDSTGVQFGDAGKIAEEREKDLIRQKSIKEGPLYKIADDPRVTPFGRFIRRWSIDELPQFFNVLFGDMSVVGPRPHQPREVALYENHHRRVLSMKPGISGLSQISGRSDLSFEDEVRLDVLYMERWSVWLDVIICVKTPFILLKRRKAL